jgi:hypothetical protein
MTCMASSVVDPGRIRTILSDPERYWHPGHADPDLVYTHAEYSVPVTNCLRMLSMR